MKKIVSAVLILAVCMSLCSCSSKNGSNLPEDEVAAPDVSDVSPDTTKGDPDSGYTGYLYYLTPEGTELRKNLGYYENVVQVDARPWSEAVYILYADGTISGYGNMELLDIDGRVSQLTDIVQIDAYEEGLCVLSSDGKVEIIGTFSAFWEEQMESIKERVSNWPEIVQISADNTTVAGLGRDGKIYKTDLLSDLTDDQPVLDIGDVKSISCDCWNLYAVLNDGRVMRYHGAHGGDDRIVEIVLPEPIEKAVSCGESDTVFFLGQSGAVYAPVWNKEEQCTEYVDAGLGGIADLVPFLFLDGNGTAYFDDNSICDDVLLIGGNGEYGAALLCRFPD